MSDYVVTDLNGIVQKAGGSDIFNTIGAAETFALERANAAREDMKVYQVTLAGTADFPSGTASWVAA